jgi:hypothetical protein
MMRVIDQTHGLNSLLKGHTSNVVDMSVVPSDSSAFAAADPKRVSVWRILSRADRIDTRALFVIQRAPSAAAVYRRVVLNDANPNTLAIIRWNATDSQYAVEWWDFTTAVAAAEQKTTEVTVRSDDDDDAGAAPFRVAVQRYDTPILDIAFSPDGSRLAIARADGRVDIRGARGAPESIVRRHVDPREPAGRSFARAVWAAADCFLAVRVVCGVWCCARTGGSQRSGELRQLVCHAHVWQ